MTRPTAPILHTALAVDPRADPRLARLPGVLPLDPARWLRVDEAYAAQMAERERLLAERPGDVLACLPEGREAAGELMALVLDDLATREGFVVGRDHVRRPDGVTVGVDAEAPLATVGRLVQGDFCLLAKPGGAEEPGEEPGKGAGEGASKGLGEGAEHVLVAAVLCFPARWTLAEKIGRPLLRIHRPVASYDPAIAMRVQRLFDGVQAGRPMWRANLLSYHDPALFQPRREDDPPLRHEGPAGYVRSEFQTIRRLPRSGAVAFGIHTVVVRREDAVARPDDGTRP
ncbi:heme-dependent oxidative N-demethylase family protein [Palleronia sp. KMU-117]|uniref:heme-dependent oxidative N-demethylase family protein n=1 Tax=Palleronia sp. KMU-117 TaxID=3434108 RepID=UPI003D7229E5